ncbi:MAG: ferritin, partial [candidate division KSB1 bacterium]|nr:ferritin [candidate division KSB1 bacterium]
VEQNKDVKIYGLDQPKQDFKSLTEVFELAWKHEQQVTKWLNEMMHLAVEEKDYATQSLLKWYIDEQVEEEASMLKILKQLQMVGEKGPGIFMLDAHLKERKFKG